VASAWISVCVVTVLAAGCFPALSEQNDAAGGADGGLAAGNGGSAGTLVRMGKPVATGMGGTGSTGGSHVGGSTGGAPVIAGGAVPSVGGSCGGGWAHSGGSPGDVSNTADAGMSAGVGGEGGGGAPPSGTGGVTSSPTQTELEAQTIERWNAIADDRAGDVFSFHWRHDMFPHPTFAAMGEANGYREFAVVLNEFLGVNFDFLAEHRQFLTPYYYVTAATSDVDLEETWDSLAADFSTMSYGDIPADVQTSLAAHRAAMKAYE
jgi:hypothetical protein